MTPFLLQSLPTFLSMTPVFRLSRVKGWPLVLFVSPRISCRFSSVFSGSPASSTSALRPFIVRISWLAAIQFRSLLPPRTLLLFHHDPLPHSSSLDRSDSTIARDKDLSPIHATASEITIYLNCYFVTWCRQTKNAKHVLHERPSYFFFLSSSKDLAFLILASIWVIVSSTIFSSFLPGTQ